MDIERLFVSIPFDATTPTFGAPIAFVDSDTCAAKLAVVFSFFLSGT